MLKHGIHLVDNEMMKVRSILLIFGCLGSVSSFGNKYFHEILIGLSVEFLRRVTGTMWTSES